MMLVRFSASGLTKRRSRLFSLQIQNKNRRLCFSPSDSEWAAPSHSASRPSPTSPPHPPTLSLPNCSSFFSSNLFKGKKKQCLLGCCYLLTLVESQSFFVCGLPRAQDFCFFFFGGAEEDNVLPRRPTRRSWKKQRAVAKVTSSCVCTAVDVKKKGLEPLKHLLATSSIFCM